MNELLSKLAVYRKLSALAYMSSYTHRGRYYSLPLVAAFDVEGLWSCRDVWFSRYGNLLATTQAFVDRSTEGYKANELAEALHVECKHALSTLVHRGQITRERMEGSYVYFAAQQARHRQQHMHRESQRASLSLLLENPQVAVEEAKAAIMLFLGTLNERQPLDSYQTMLNFIRGTSTQTGLRVEASLNRRKYQCGIQISNEQMQRIHLKTYTSNPLWNYSLAPS